MADWATFVGISGVVLVLLLVLSHLTQSAFSDQEDGGATLERPPSGPGDEPPRVDRPTDADGDSDTAFEPTTDSDPKAGTDPVDSSVVVEGDAGIETDVADGREAGSDAVERTPPAVPDSGTDDARSDEVDLRSLSTGELLANVAVSQGLFAVVLIGAVIYTGIPLSALGIEFSAAYVEQALVLGVAFGVVLYLANEVAAATATRFGFDHDEELRELLAPDSMQGWIVLLVIVLPVIAVFEELLFRAALIGVPAAGFDVSPWLLAVVSSVAFAAGHGMQGSVGVVVTGILGFVLAGIYIETGSLLVVIVAHYLINAFEFVVHEGVGFDWAETLES